MQPNLWPPFANLSTVKLAGFPLKHSFSRSLPLTFFLLSSFFLSPSLSNALWKPLCPPNRRIIVHLARGSLFPGCLCLFVQPFSTLCTLVERNVSPSRIKIWHRTTRYLPLSILCTLHLWSLHFYGSILPPVRVGGLRVTSMYSFVARQLAGLNFMACLRAAFSLGCSNLHGWTTSLLVHRVQRAVTAWPIAKGRMEGCVLERCKNRSTFLSVEHRPAVFWISFRNKYILKRALLEITRPD